MNNEKISGKKILTKKDIMPAFLIFLGILPGMICYSRLPDEMPINFGIDNKVNQLAPKGFVILVLPILMVLYHLFICAVLNYIDNGNIPKGIKIIVRHVVPTLVIIMEVVTVMFSLDIFKNVGLVACTAVGLLWMGYGNYLPKVRCVKTNRFRLPRLFTDEALWSGFSRLVGWFILFCGVMMIIFAFLNMTYACVGILIGSIAIPVIYAFAVSKKSKASK